MHTVRRQRQLLSAFHRWPALSSSSTAAARRAPAPLRIFIFISRSEQGRRRPAQRLVGAGGAWTSAVRCLQRACRNGSYVSTLEGRLAKSPLPRRSTTAPFGRQLAALAMCTIRRFTEHSRHRADWPRNNRKAVGPKGAVAIILAAARRALANIPGLDFSADASPPPPLPARFFSRVWLGLAGVLHQRDIDEIAPHAQEAFGIAGGDPALRISNGASAYPSSFGCTRSRR